MINMRATIARPAYRKGFTVTELLVSISVLAVVVLLITQLVHSASMTVRPSTRHIDTDTEARLVLDRMATDFAQLLKRPDIDYYLKANSTKYPGHSGGHSNGGGQQGQTDLNDYIGFYTQSAGYWSGAGAASPISLVGYRVNGLQQSNGAQNPAYNRLERRSETLVWNGSVTLPAGNVKNATTKPIFFLPLLISAIWPSISNNDTSTTVDQPYIETIGPNVFRFEYCYLLKTGVATDTPWNTDMAAGPVYGTFNGLSDVEAISVTIAVIDPQSRKLLVQDDSVETKITNLQLLMGDFKSASGRGPNGTKSVIDTEYQWNCVLTNGNDPACQNYRNPNTAVSAMPQTAISAIRVYTRTFDLKPL